MIDNKSGTLTIRGRQQAMSLLEQLHSPPFSPGWSGDRSTAGAKAVIINALKSASTEPRANLMIVTVVRCKSA